MFTDRGDTWEKPRSLLPSGEFPTAKTQAQLTKGPLLIGAQNLIIAMPEIQTTETSSRHQDCCTRIGSRNCSREHDSDQGEDRERQRIRVADV